MEELAIVSEQQAFTHWKVATDIYNVLKTKVPKCNLYDWAAREIPEKNILFVATILSTSLHYLSRFLPNKKVVFYTTLEGEPIVDPIGRNIAKNIKIVAVSHFAEEMLQHVELDCDGVVYHGIPMLDTQTDPRFDEFLNTIQYPPNKPKTRRRKYLTISSNMERKGLDHLLVAHKLVEFNNPDAILILHSGGGFYDITHLADLLEVGFENFWFTNSFGMYDDYQMNSLIHFSQFLVQPSFTEGYGLPMAEGLKHEKPVIAIDAPPYNEIIQNGVTGLLIPVRQTTRVKFLNRIMLLMRLYSVDDLAEAISKMLNDKYRQTLSANITKKVKMRFEAADTYPALLRHFE